MLQNILIRPAQEKDIPAIVGLFSDDILGKTREASTIDIPKSYYDAFHNISQDTNQLLIVLEKDKKVIGTLQITFLTHMSHQGAKRALIEGVHVAKDYRSQGIGAVMMEWAINKAKEQHCRFVQLTSNKQRMNAHRFYCKLGFENSHEGFKLDLAKP